MSIFKKAAKDASKETLIKSVFQLPFRRHI